MTGSNPNSAGTALVPAPPSADIAMIEIDREHELLVLRFNDPALSAIVAGTLDVNALLRDVIRSGAV